MAKTRRLRLPNQTPAAPAAPADDVVPAEERDYNADFLNGSDVTNSLRASAEYRAARRVGSREWALAVAAVFGCIRILSNGASTLPMDSFIRRDGIKRPYRPRPEWLNFNATQDNKIDVIGTLVMSLLLDGNAYLATPRDDAGNIIYVEVLDPDMVEPYRADNQRVRFKVTTGTGGYGDLDEYAIHHIPNLRLPGKLKGMSPVAMAATTIGISHKAEEYGETFYSKGVKPNMVVELDPNVNYTPKAVEDLRHSIRQNHGGSNAHDVMVLTKGAKAKALSISPSDAQFIQTRKLQVPEIAMLFGVPVHLLGHSDAPQFGSSIAEQNVAYVQHSLRPLVERVEQGLSDAQRLAVGSPQDLFVGFNMIGLLRGDHETHVQSNIAEIMQGSLTINEHRAEFDRPPVPWGDEPISVQTKDDPMAAAAAAIDTPPPSPEDDTEESDE